MIPFAIEWYLIALMIFVGFYGMLASRSIVRQLIGLEIVSKGAMLALISAGFLADNLIYAQALLLTMIVIEVVVVAAGLALLVKAFRLNGSADIWRLDSLKG
jgi:NADH:ubiquinone oxidoreductase subunit K